MIKGWLNITSTPEKLLENYVSTGDSDNVARLVALFNESIYHYLLSLSDKETAEDAVQSTRLKVIKVKSTSRQHTNVKSWLYTIARNTLIDELRRSQKWQWQELEEQYLQSCSVGEIIETDNRLVLFNRAMSQLPFYQREAFIFQQEGFSVTEIAMLTNESFETVKSRLRYARNNLQAMLGNNHER